MKTRQVFKSILSVSLAIALLVCSVPMTTVAAIASSTNNIPNYITFQAELYSSEEVGFDNIFVGTDSSSFARTYFNDMRNDDKFIASVNAWEAIHIATSPSYSLESGMINKKDFYETILFDMLDVSDNGSLASEFGSTYSKLFKAIKNQNNSFVISTANKIMGKDGISADELNTFKYADLSDDAKKLLLSGSKYAEISSVVSDVNKLLGYAKSAYEAIEKVSDYLSIKEYQDGTKEILDYIVSDTRNDPQLRLAAGTVSECFDKSFDSVLIAISEGTLSGLETCLGEVMDGAWGKIVATIPGGSAVLLAAKGSRLLCNYLFSTDKEIEGYYLLEASVKMEDAFIRALTAAQDDMKKDSVGTATVYMQGISMYKNVILLGFDYSIDLLETAANSKFNTSTDFWLGNYSECISLMNDIESFKTQKINNYAAYENMVFNAYKQKYFPNYDEVESSLDKAKVLISSMEVSQIKNINIGDNGSIYDFFSFKYYPENHTELSIEDGVTSSDESVIKVTKNSWTCDSITAVGKGTCTLTFSSNLGEFEASIEVTVGGSTGSSDHDYLKDFKYEVNEDGTTATICAYKGSQSNLIIPSFIDGYKITHIGENAFRDYTGLAYIKIPGTVEEIGCHAFCGIRINNFEIPDTVKLIKTDAFASSSLQSLTISDKTKVESDSGSNVHFLENVEIKTLILSSGSETLDIAIGRNTVETIIIPSSVTNLNIRKILSYSKLQAINIERGNSVYSSIDGVLYSKDKSELIRFPANKNITTFQIDDFVEKIGGDAFYNCISLASIKIPNGVTSIGSYAFYNCSELKNVTIPNSVSIMGEHAFENCTKLESIKMPCDLRTIYGTDFMGTWFINCVKLESMILTEGLSKRVSALRSAISDTNIKKIILEDGIKEIECYALQNCSNIEEIEFCDTLEDIQYCAFKNCTSLTRIVLPNNLRFLGSWAFENCSNLNDISILSDKIEGIGNAAFSGTAFYNNSENWTNEVLYIGNYLISANTVLEGTYIVKDNTRVVADQAFKGCNKITEINLPDSVKFIGENSFESCYNLEKITLSKEIISFGRYAFKGCNIKIVYYNGEIEDWLKYNCFTEPIYLNTGELDRNEYAENNPCGGGADLYINGEKLTNLLIPDNISIINNAAFYNCDSIEEVIVSENVTHIGESAFKYCSNLKTVQLPANIESIDDSAFYYTGIRGGYLTIPKSCNFIGNSAFNYSYFGGICILNSTCEIGNSAFHYGTTVYGYENSSAERFCENNDDYFSPDFEPIDGFNCEMGKHRFVVSALSGKAICAICHEEFVNNDDILAKLVYSIENGEVVITDFIDRTAQTLTIPEKISKYPVTKINFLAYNNNLKNIYIPKTVKEITGIQCWDNIYVDEENEWFCSIDGILYNKTKTELIYYPHNKINDVTIIDGVEKIRNGAFDCSGTIPTIYLLSIPNSIKTIGNQVFSNVYIKHIFYNGTEEEWNEIEIGSENSNLLNGSLHFNAIDSDKSITTILPTCTDDGYTVYNCNICNEEYCSNYVDSLGHDYVLIETIEPTCTRGGYDIYTCSRCEEEYYSNYTGALGHNIVDGVCKNCGQDEDYCIESEHNYANNCDQTWTLNKPNAQSVAVTFSLDTYVERGYDFIYIYDANDALIGKYTGNELAGKRIVVLGDTVKIRLTSDGSNTGFGFAFSKVETNIPQDVESKGIIVTEGKIGDFSSDTRLKVESLETTKERIVYDISLMKGDTEIQPSMPVAVRIPVPANMNGENCKVYRQEADGTYTDMNAVYQDGYMVFTTDHFSVYVLTTNNPNVLFGDTNADGTIDDWDSVLLERYLAGWEVEINTSAADIDKNGVVDDWDGVLLARKLAGWK